MSQLIKQFFSKSVTLKCFGVILFLCLITDFSCTPSPCRYENPNQAKFNQLVLSSALRDSLQDNTITIGMPYFVVQDIFKNCGREIGIQVASVGSKKECLEREGLYSNYQDQGIEIYLDQYHTAQGTLYVWYGDPSFYRSLVASGDSIYLFKPDKIVAAKILYLLKPTKLKIDKKLEADALQYVEIHHDEPNGKITYWYHVTVSDSVVKFEAQKKSEYPIFSLELENNPIKSFHWK